MCRILLVDDTPDVRTTISGLLEDQGYSVHLASDESEALAAIMDEDFDIAIIDVRLRGDDETDESGLSLAMAIRKINEAVHIILYTGLKISSQQVVRAIRYAGAVNVIEKKPGFEKFLLDAIRESQQEAKFIRAGQETRLSLSLANGQPLFVKTCGRHVQATRTWTVLRLDLERYTRRTELARKSFSDLRFQVSDIGDRLWREVFSEHKKVSDIYHEARGKSTPLMLRFEAPRDYLGLPLEFMRSETPADYLILQHPFARFIYDAVPKRQSISPSGLMRTKKLRILLIASNTDPQIDGVDVEIRDLQKFLQRQDCISVQVKCLPSEQATYKRIQRELSKSKYDIIHYAGHGSFNTISPEESSLYFWNADNKEGDVQPMTASELQSLLEQSETRLLYLSSCYGTTTGKQDALLDDDFLGLSDAAIQSGVPSVIGFRWPVSDWGAPKLALAFYKSLLQQGSPEVALWRARCELASNRDDPTWLSPILIQQE
ncbi:MAG TPA: CHAT domain-containing protein [Chloroflexi bacterium]|nr:CHAT domain-containing protein [Chloroflexota bacterium]